MSRMLLFLHHIALPPHALHILPLTHVCSYTLDHAEPEFEEPTVQARAEDFANLVLNQDKPQCI
jgi:hypothetical protein